MGEQKLTMIEQTTMGEHAKINDRRQESTMMSKNEYERAKIIEGRT